ncbi:fimbrial protein [Halobacteriovorax sp. GFR7]|uniref:fimbrial protein n=1 Tax=unclassified Halobacteriovorax TaxID=2639665 RepID=UPI00371408DA
MKIVKGLFISSLVMVSTAYAATTGTLVLKGQVPALLSISVTPEAVASALPLDTTQVDSKVATVNEVSNSNSGYTVSFSSANQGKLVHNSVASSSIDYALSYDGNAVDLSTTDVFTFPSAASVNVDKDLAISYTGVDHQNLIQGEYADTVTLTIAAN